MARRYRMTLARRGLIFEAHTGVCGVSELRIKYDHEIYHTSPLGLSGSDRNQNLCPAHPQSLRKKTYGSDPTRGDVRQMRMARRPEPLRLGSGRILLSHSPVPTCCATSRAKSPCLLEPKERYDCRQPKHGGGSSIGTGPRSFADEPGEGSNDIWSASVRLAPTEKRGLWPLVGPTGRQAARFRSRRLLRRMILPGRMGARLGSGRRSRMKTARASGYPGAATRCQVENSVLLLSLDCASALTIEVAGHYSDALAVSFQSVAEDYLARRGATDGGEKGDRRAEVRKIDVMANDTRWRRRKRPWVRTETTLHSDAGY